jgi:2-oxoglutarate ferredoxin oxidoreductase subunit beta
MQAGTAADFVDARQEISVSYATGELLSVQMHDGSHVNLRKLDRDYRPTDRDAAYSYIQERARQNEYVTGLIYIDESSRDLHEQSGTTDVPLNSLPYDKLSPGSAGLSRILSRYR